MNPVIEISRFYSEDKVRVAYLFYHQDKNLFEIEMFVGGKRISVKKLKNKNIEYCEDLCKTHVYQ
jgi:hypothetical protein